MYKIGWCAPIELAGQVREHHYDFIECAVASLALEDRDEHRQLLPRYKEAGLPLWAFNGFFPGDIKVVGELADRQRITNYVERAAEALHELGARIAVLGSGGARRIPTGWEFGRARAQFLELLGVIADSFAGSGVTLAIEPLNKRECNFINLVSEAAALAREVNRPEIRVLADFYHMQEGAEPLGAIEDNRDYIAHVHLADTARKRPGSGGYPYAQLAAILQRIDYKGLLSVECIPEDLALDLPNSIQFLRQRFQ